jgi:arylsulfatase A-like enzyme
MRCPLAAALLAMIPVILPATERPPNFLVIQCDDLGWDDLGLHHPLVATPRIDALGRESLRFTQFTVNPVCAPSRATFLTGRHFLRTGVSHVHGGKDFLHPDERTLADHLRAAGYATGLWGKWHSGMAEGYFPWQRGFDEAYAADLYRHRTTRGQFNGTPVEHAGWADAVIADQAINFITRHRDRPWLAYLPTLTPHSPFDAPDEFIAPYRAHGDLSPALATLWGMVSHLDHQIGRVLDALDRLGLANNTVVLFFSDNGPAHEGSRLSDEDRRVRKVAGLRGWKGDLYENGVRSPLFIRWPGRLDPRVIDTPLDHVDLTPTLLDLAGAAPVPDALPLDGRSFLPLLTRHAVAPGATPPYHIFNYAHRGWLRSGPPYSLDGIPGEYRPVPADERATLSLAAQSLSVREGSLKLVLNPDYPDHDAPAPRVALYDLATDPGETTDVAEVRPADRDRLLAALTAWWGDVRREPHAFTPPTFTLVGPTPRLPANAPTTLHGAVFNTVVGLKGFARPGDAAHYRVRAPVAGRYRAALIWNPAPPAGANWLLDGQPADQAEITLAPEPRDLVLTLVTPAPDLPAATLRRIDFTKIN